MLKNTAPSKCRCQLTMDRYTFYDGPPFATGTPHYGHILAGTIKVRCVCYLSVPVLSSLAPSLKPRKQDVMTRYAHQTGHHVERRFGWDCHGLPVEYEIDKTFNVCVCVCVCVCVEESLSRYSFLLFSLHVIRTNFLCARSRPRADQGPA
jgi:hypothetical protein